MPAYEGVVFDFDGVLADSIGAHTDARLQAFAERGHSVDMSLHDEAHMHGTHPAEIIGWVLATAGIIPSGDNYATDPETLKMVQLKTDIYREVTRHGLDPVPGALQTVHAAYDAFGAERLAIATTASYDHEVAPYLKRHGLQGIFSVIISKDETPENQTKPHPFVYSRSAMRLGFSGFPEVLVAVEDHPKGIESAKAANLSVVGLCTTHLAATLEAADIVVADHTELRTVLEIA